jgi:hypothetical protein
MAVDPRTVDRWLTESLPFFNEHANIVVKDKRGALVPYKLNLAQRYIHDRLEEQRRRTGGWVRACLLKGRQQGGSTYIQNRFYHRTMRVPGMSAFILSHESKTTDKLFAMVRRFYENMAAAMRPTLGADNPRQMTFPALNADYAAGTARNEDAGRGGTAQLFHGSEAAYWPNAYAIQDGALESIALVPGTEIILESTANGPVGLFYDKCKQAMAGIGDYILVFVPWYWDAGYERDPGPDFEPTEAERAFMHANFVKAFPYESEPISEERAYRKLAWRRAKVIDLTGNNNPEGGEAKFRAIYPSNPIEAFLATAVGIVRSDAVTRARSNWHSPFVDEFAPRILGVDPAGNGKKSDRTVLLLRQGRRVEKVIAYPKMKPMELAGIVATMIENEHLDMVFIDRGYGEGTIDRLHELRYGPRVVGVHFKERPTNDIYMNKRSEIIIEAAKWLNDNDDIAVPDDGERYLSPAGAKGPRLCSGDEIHADLAAMPLDKETSEGIKYMPPKEQIVAELGRSPDIFDALALTFSYPVKRAGLEQGGGGWRKAQSSGGLRSMRRWRA